MPLPAKKQPVKEQGLTRTLKKHALTTYAPIDLEKNRQKTRPHTATNAGRRADPLRPIRSGNRRPSAIDSRHRPNPPRAHFWPYRHDQSPQFGAPHLRNGPRPGGQGTVVARIVIAANDIVSSDLQSRRVWLSLSLNH